MKVPTPSHSWVDLNTQEVLHIPNTSGAAAVWVCASIPRKGRFKSH